MLTSARTRISAAVLLAFVALLVLALVGPAYASKPSTKDASARSAKAPSSSQWTEDTDTNDNNTPNNVVDAGDNKHPSGKDRSVENGNSGNQGKAKADPDDTSGPKRSNGGVDQPNGPGGSDKADQDGNNGCGNDDDFEDDNNGLCGGKPKPAKPSTPSKPSNPGKPSKPGKPAKPNTPNTPNTPSNPGNPGNPGKPAKVGVCHRTGSATNPYVYIEVSEKGLAGHSGHSGDMIGVSGPDACPGGTSTTPPSTNPGGPGGPGDDVEGEVVIRRPNTHPAADDPIVIITTPRRVPVPSRSIERDEIGNDPNAHRVLASTGGRLPMLLSIAGLSLLMGAGLLGSRRFASKQ